MTMSPPPEQPIAYATPVANNQDLEHLKILSICHWVWGGLEILFSCIFIFHIVMGILALNGTFPMNNGKGNGPPPELFGWFFLCFGSCALLFGWICGILTIWCGFNLRSHKRRTLSFVVAGISCLSVPIGTTLGVFTIIVLVRPSVKQLYEQEALRRVEV